MTQDALNRLWQTARQLPGDSVPVSPALPIFDAQATASAPPVAQLRTATAGWLNTLAQRVEGPLAHALAPNWDQVGQHTVMDAPLHAQTEVLVAGWLAAGGHGQESVRAEALAALMLVDAVRGLVEMVENRLAVLAGLCRENNPEQDGPPALDVAAALKEAAKVWA